MPSSCSIKLLNVNTLPPESDIGASPVMYKTATTKEIGLFAMRDALEKIMEESLVRDTLTSINNLVPHGVIRIEA